MPVDVRDWIETAVIVGASTADTLLVWDIFALIISILIFIGQIVATSFEMTDLYSTQWSSSLDADALNKILKSNLAFSILDLLFSLLVLVMDSIYIYVEARTSEQGRRMISDNFRFYFDLGKYCFSIAMVISAS